MITIDLTDLTYPHFLDVMAILFVLNVFIMLLMLDTNGCAAK